jgi:cyclo(L-tyrosyl-L-tyrosyl) synthase
MDDTTPRSPDTDFTTELYTANCRTIYERADHVLIGVSPGNGYFSEERLARLLRWADGIFARVDPIVPDSAIVHTLAALGATPEQAQFRAQRATRRQCRRIERAWQASGVPAERHHVRTLSEFARNPRYVELFARCEEAISHDPEVREVFRGSAESALTSQLKLTSDADTTAPTSTQVEEAMRYLVAEVPLLTDTPGVLGVPSSVHVYHRMLPVLPVVHEKLFISPRQAFAVVRPREGTEPPGTGGQDAGPVRYAPTHPGEGRR